MAQLYRVGNPIDREERANLNLTLDDIQNRFSLLQSQVNFLSGGADVEGLIQEINQAITNAEQATDDVDNAIALIDDKIIELESEIAKAENLKGMGQWNSTTQYKKNNIVGDDGNSYMALVDNTNVPTSDTNTWMLSSSKGDTGKGLTIKGTLTNSSQLPSTGEDGDAYYIGTNLWVWMVDHWEDIGQIKGDKGDPGSDANVTTANIENALGYTPANQSLLNSFKGQYEFRTATIFDRQIRITKPDASNRIPILLNVDLEQGGPITVSLDSGSTSLELKNVDGTDVTKLDKGFIEIVQTGSFFTLRNTSAGMNQSDLDALITLTNEADENDSVLRNEFIDTSNDITGGTLSNDATWNEILLSLSNVTTGVSKRIGQVTSPTGQVAFVGSSGSASNSNYVDIPDLGFEPKSVTLVNANFTSVTFTSLEFPLQGGYTIIRAATSSFRLQSPAVLNGTNTRLPVPSGGVVYNYIAVG